MNTNKSTPPEMTPVKKEEPIPAQPQTKDLLDGLLRRPADLISVLDKPNHKAVPKLLIIALFSTLLFGVVLGCFSKHEQLYLAPIKITVGLIFACIICTPSLFIFMTLSGARVSPSLLASAISGMAALLGLLLLGFAPAVLLFAESSNSAGFVGLISLLAWSFAVFFGAKFLRKVASECGGTKREPLIVWTIVFMLVTLQLTTSLRPILGRSDKAITDEKKFFTQHWLDVMSEDGEQKNSGQTR